MKKVFVFLMLLCASMLQARFFIGIEGGYSAQGIPTLQGKGKGIEFHTISTGALGDILKHGADGYSLSVVLGSESFFGRYFGLRWGVGAGYSSSELEFEEKGKEQEVELKAILANMSVDVLLNVVNTGYFSFGFFGGTEVDYQYFTSSGSPNIHAVGFLGRAGVSTLLASHHRMEVFAKIPFADMSSKFALEDKNAIAFGTQQISFGASYKFVF